VFFRAKATIDDDDQEWQLACWQWLFDNLGGTAALRRFRTVLPSHADFPTSGKTGYAHAVHVFAQVVDRFGLDSRHFELREQEAKVDPVLSSLAVVQNAPTAPRGTYTTDDAGRHVVSYSPDTLQDLEALIATFAHEICHSILFGIDTEPPGGAEAEEFATDLATVFFGFGIFGGNGAFRFRQFVDAATNTQGWSTERSGYLTQNEWGYALAVRGLLLDEDIAMIARHCTDGLALNLKKNARFLRNNPERLAALAESG